MLTLMVIIITAIVPVIGILSGPLIFMIQSYYAGFGNIDFTLERHFRIRESVDFVKEYKGLAVGNGLPFLLLLAIPVVGVFLAPGLATVAATVESVHRLKHEGRLSLIPSHAL
jgi:CysZ protein